MKKKAKTKKRATGKKAFNFYQVISQNKKFNYGAFPASKEGLGMARNWADRMTEETGEKCVVKKR
jgi:hypothetical protein